MTVAHRTLALIICMGLSACGNHREAPVVYGASQSHSARIYNSPEEIYRKQQAERARAIEANAAPSRMTATPVSARSAPAPLKPVSAVYLDDGAAASSAAPRAKAKGYIEVQPGDTVYAIGRRFNVSPAAIIDENDLRAPYALTIGQALKLPKGASTARKVVARDTLYSVRQGDTLYSISRASNVSVNAIAQANALRPPYSLAVGQRIAIPQAPTNSALYARANGSSSKPAASKIDNTAAAPRNVGELARQASY
ncbi:MAG: LysM peptidoglycan-binding domain-containing protein, partial [Hyphococcus sp.]